MSQQAMATKLGLGIDLIGRLERGDDRVQLETRAEVAAFLGLEFDWSTGLAVKPSDAPFEPLHDNLADTPSREYAAPPTWPRLAVAASHFVDWHEVGEVGKGMIAETLRVGRFRIPIIGDCMRDKWQSGDLVEFELLRDELDFMPGMDVYVETPDGSTFKRCFYQDEEVIKIECLHGPKKRWTIERRNIKRAAVARFALITRPD